MLALAAVFAASVQVAYGQSALSKDVCPSATWKSRTKSFVGDPENPSYFVNITDWTSSNATAYVKDDVLKKDAANLAFIGIALLSLIIFLLWRLLRCLGICCCCKESCRASHLATDGRRILKGPWMWVGKVALLLFGLTAIALSIYGMTQADPTVVKDTWSTVDVVTNYTNRLEDRFNELMGNLSRTTPIVAALQNISTSDVQANEFRNKLQTLGNFLDSDAANPNNIASLITSVGGATSDLSSASSQLTSLPSSLSALSSAATSLTGATTLLSNITTSLNTLQSALSNVPSSEPFSQASDSTITALSSALTTTVSASTLSSWISSLDALSASLAVVEEQRTSAPYSSAQSALTGLQASASGSGSSGGSGTSFGSLSSQLSTFIAAWNTTLPAGLWVLDRLRVINSTVVAFTPNMQLAYDKVSRLLNLSQNLTSQIISPATLASNLTSLQGSLVLPASTTTFAANLGNISAALSALPSLAPAQNYVTGLRSTLAALQSPLSKTSSALTAYQGSPSSGSYTTLYATISGSSGSLQAATVAQGVASAGTSAAAAFSSLQSTVTRVNASVSAASGALSGQQSAVGSLTSLLGSAAAASQVSSYLDILSGIADTYNNLPTPKSNVLAPAYSALDTLDSAVGQGNEAQALVASIITVYNGTAGKVLNDFNTKAQDIRADYEDESYKWGSILYKVTLGMFGAGILAVLLLFLFGVLNCPAGIALTIIFTLVVTVIYFILAAVFAGALIVANDGCPAAEPVLIRQVTPKYRPLAQYAVFGTGGDVNTALLNAGLLNVTQVQSQLGLVGNVTQQITSQYTPVGHLKAVVQQVTDAVGGANTSLNACLTLASYNQTNAVYSTAKSYPCCTLPNSVSTMWIILTVGGWFLLATAWMAQALLGRLDKLWRSGACCACTCFKASDADKLSPEHSITMPPPPAIAMDKPPHVNGGEHRITIPPESHTNGNGHVALANGATHGLGGRPAEPARPPGYYPAVPYHDGSAVAPEPSAPPYYSPTHAGVAGKAA